MHPQITMLKNEVCGRKKIKISMLRLDEIHPVVSGNKIFKLRYFLDEARSSVHKQIITFGGAYSNHLAATAFACKKEGVKSIGIARGEKPDTLSPTLKFCTEQGMQLAFISRSSYEKKDTKEFENLLTEKYGDHTLIPEGGFSQKGAKGAEMIMDTINKKDYTHVCCAIGTATTFAGLINGCDNIHIIGFSVLKNLNDIEERLKKLNTDKTKNYSIINNYHFGGYAKKTKELINFMNTFYEDNKIPLDFVYTGKMMFGVYDIMNKNYFPNGSNILCIHTGGLQGNQSLAAEVLNF
jgi:1-aminocyclopropane-1-carboxylate deaminase